MTKQRNFLLIFLYMFIDFKNDPKHILKIYLTNYKKKFTQRRYPVAYFKKIIFKINFF